MGKKYYQISDPDDGPVHYLIFKNKKDAEAYISRELFDLDLQYLHYEILEHDCEAGEEPEWVMMPNTQSPPDIEDHIMDEEEAKAWMASLEEKLIKWDVEGRTFVATDPTLAPGGESK